MTRQRIRRQIDRGRLGGLASQPGIDPRSWVVLARVDDDDDAIRWSGADGEDGPLGWIVDVTIQGGDLDQEGPIACRLGASYAGAGELRSDPPGRDCFVIVLLPCGGLNTEPTIIGELPSDGCAPPDQVNGTDVDEAYALATHFFVTSKAVDQEIAGDRRVQTGAGSTHRILGEAVELADEGASQAFVKGNDQQGALDSWFDAFNTWITLVQTGIVAGGGTLVNTAIELATAQLRSDLQSALSTKIKGE